MAGMTGMQPETELRLSITEVKSRWFELIERIEAGETIVVTRRGKPVVDLRPHRDLPGDR